MKRIIALFLCVVLLCSVTSCGMLEEYFPDLLGDSSDEGSYDENSDPSAEENRIRGEYTKTANSNLSVLFGAESDTVRADLNDVFNTKLANTQKFAQVSYTGTAYYISPNGKTTNTGKSESSPWPISKLSSATLKSGDAVLFQCGATFRMTSSITAVSGVTYSSYGTGAKPIFYGSTAANGASSWQAVSGKTNVYKCTVKTFTFSSNDVGSIVFNNGAAWGIKIQQLASYSSGKWSYQSQTLKLNDVSNGLETFDLIPSYTLSSGGDLKDYDLTFFHGTDGRVYVYSEKGNPGTRFSSVEISNSMTFFTGTDKSDVTIANIDFRNSGRMGIRTMNAKNLTVKNCSFRFIGGTIQKDYGTWRNYNTRLGNAIENWNAVDGMTVENCYFDQIYDTAMTTQSNSKVNMNNVKYRNNVVDHVWFGVELWAGDGDGGCQFNNAEVSGNYFRNIGLGFTSQRPDKDENGAGIEGFIKVSRGAYTVNNAQVVNNYVDGTRGRLMECVQMKSASNSNGFLFDRNTYVGIVGAKAFTIHSDYPASNGKYSPSETNHTFDYETLKSLKQKGFEENGVFYCIVNAENEEEVAAQSFLARKETLPYYTYKMKDGTTIPFRLIFPENYNAAKQYSLITFLNMEKASGTDNEKNLNMASALINKLAVGADAILLIPQCPSGTWTGRAVASGNWTVADTEETATMKAVANLIADIAADYGVTKKIAVGVDAGGYAVSDLLVRHKNLLDKAVIVSGAGDPSADIGHAKVWIVHAEFDTTLAVSNAEALKTAWNAKYTKYGRGVVHDCWVNFANNANLIEWLNQ